MSNEYCDELGRRVRLVGKLAGASGGEGQIWETDDPSLVAKTYFTPDEERTRKLQWMLEHPPEDPTAGIGHVSIAWPRHLLRTNGSPLWSGFLMARVSNSVSGSVVYNARSRNKWRPGFNWRHLHATAQNVASTVAALHQAKYVVGDLKPENLLVNAQALVTLVDVDSIQVLNPAGGYFRCRVGTLGFLPPELLSVTLTGADRSPRHDAFALAIILYQLLCDQHPYLGGGADEPDAIRHGWWKHGPNSPVTEHRNHIAFAALAPELQAHFRACFTDGHGDPSQRPDADAWRGALRRAGDALRPCSNHPNHWYSPHQSSCYWCERRKQLGVDVFDRTERALAQVTSASTTPSATQNCGKCGQSGHGQTNCATPICAVCLSFGHWSFECPGARRCSGCDETGHDIRTCPNVRRCSICYEPGHDRRNHATVWSSARRGSRRCKATMVSGERCGASALDGNFGYCGRHL